MSNWDGLRGSMRGQDCVVLGCGPSLYLEPTATLRQYHLIGSNRSVMHVACDAAVCIEPNRSRCWEDMAQGMPSMVFSHHSLGWGSATVFPRQLDTWGSQFAAVPFLASAAYYAAAVALWWGFDHVGLVGVDLCGHSRYDDNPGFLESSLVAWSALGVAAGREGQQILNLSPASALATITTGEITQLRPKPSL